MIERIQASFNQRLRLSLYRGTSQTGLLFQVIEIELTQPDRLIFPQDLITLQLPEGLDPSLGVVLTGRGPIWLYGALVHECHFTRWVACYDPRFPGAVVVSSHSPEVRMGEVIEWREGPVPSHCCPAMVVVGPPNSGKSHLAKALFERSLRLEVKIYLQRAHWDGEGNWSMDLESLSLDGSVVRALRQRYKGGPTPTYFEYQAQVVTELRNQKKLVIVDLGGKIDRDKLPLLQACTHYLLVSRDPQLVHPWQEFCETQNLKPIAIIHSTLDVRNQVLKTDPVLELCLGGSDLVPDLLLERLESIWVRK